MIGQTISHYRIPGKLGEGGVGEVFKAIDWAERAYVLDPDDSYLVYGLACFFAQPGDLERALDHFQTAVEAGFAHREWIDNDTDLDPIRQTERFKKRVEQL